MKIQDLLKKIEALENRVKELEARPMQSVPVYMPNHFIQAPPPTRPIFWTVKFGNKLEELEGRIFLEP